MSALRRRDRGAEQRLGADKRLALEVAGATAYDDDRTACCRVESERPEQRLGSGAIARNRQRGCIARLKPDLSRRAAKLGGSAGHGADDPSRRWPGEALTVIVPR